MKELAARAQQSGNHSLLLNENVRSLRWTGGDDRNQGFGNDNGGGRNDKDRNKRTRKRAEQRRNNKHNQKQEVRDFYNPEKQGPYQQQQQQPQRQYQPQPMPPTPSPWFPQQNY